MEASSGGLRYVPGTYKTKRSGAGELADRYIREWDEKRHRAAKIEEKAEIPVSICFSRKIGVGALEVAVILAKEIGYRLVDREILEHIAGEAKLSEKTVRLFDERYPGRLKEFLSFAFGPKAFIESDYARRLFRAVVSIAGLGPTIFVGRGVHLLLPRDRVLAVRFICSKEHRIKRVARILGTGEKEAEVELDRVDREQKDFFKKVYRKKDASPYEFDLVINYDHISNPQWAAEIVAVALKQKFEFRTEP
jgi:cytidylate kinase